jgi:hypothetical protein
MPQPINGKQHLMTDFISAVSNTLPANSSEKTPAHYADYFVNIFFGKKKVGKLALRTAFDSKQPMQAAFTEACVANPAGVAELLQQCTFTFQSGKPKGRDQQAEPTFVISDVKEVDVADDDDIPF